MLIIKLKIFLFVIFFLFSGNFLLAQNSFNGLVTEEITSKDGKISVFLPSHLPQGKTISGTVFSEPEDEKTAKKAKQIENLAKYILKIGGEIIQSSGIFTLQLPELEQTVLQVFSPENKLLRKINLALSNPEIQSELYIPKVVRSGAVEKVEGNFSGDILKAKLLIDEQPVDVLAGNESELFFKTSEIETGRHKISLDYEKAVFEEDINVVDYSLQAGKLNLKRGESTYIDVVVEGLEENKEPVLLNISNQTVGIVALEGGENQSILITPEKVDNSGIWRKRFNVQSLTSGSFSVSTNLEVPKKNKKPSDSNVWENLVLTGKRAKIVHE